MPEDVAPSRDTALEGEAVASGNVTDIDEIQSGVDVAEHAAGERVADDPPGRRRSDIARADRRRGVHDRRPNTGRGCLGDKTLGVDLRALVGADRLPVSKRCVLVAREAVGTDAHRRDRGGVDEVCPRGSGDGDHRRGAADVCADHLSLGVASQ